MCCGYLCGEPSDTRVATSRGENSAIKRRASQPPAEWATRETCSWAGGEEGQRGEGRERGWEGGGRKGEGEDLGAGWEGGGS